MQEIKTSKDLINQMGTHLVGLMANWVLVSNLSTTGVSATEFEVNAHPEFEPDVLPEFIQDFIEQFEEDVTFSLITLRFYPMIMYFRCRYS